MISLSFYVRQPFRAESQAFDVQVLLMKSSPQHPHMSLLKTPFVNWPDALEQVKEGNRDAFLLIYKECHAKLYAYVLKFVGASAFTRDILQEVFLKIWEHRLKINPSLSFNAYVYKICQNALLKYIKSPVKSRIASAVIKKCFRAP